jgi:hypothetical protein
MEINFTENSFSVVPTGKQAEPDFYATSPFFHQTSSTIFIFNPILDDESFIDFGFSQSPCNFHPQQVKLTKLAELRYL